LLGSDRDATSPRIISLIASATEIVYALGCGDWLVGRSHECDFPPEVTTLPVCSAARIDVHADSREIDRQVKSALADKGGVYRLESAQLEDLRPTVVLTQQQCEVCAVSLADVESAVCEFHGDRPQVVSLQPNSLSDVWEDFRRVGEALGVAERAEALIEHCRARLDALRSPGNAFPGSLTFSAEMRRDPGIGAPIPMGRPGLPQRPRVACLEWIEPLMAAGNWVPELVEIAGGVNLFGLAGQHSPWMTWAELVNADPDIIVLMPCGFDIPRTAAELHWLTDRPEWPTLAAVRNHRVYVTDGNQYFNRPGPRLMESAEILAEIFYPGQVNYGHRDAGWIDI
jgi:iron complex transport system substrate-binding protein